MLTCGACLLAWDKNSDRRTDRLTSKNHQMFAFAGCMCGDACFPGTITPADRCTRRLAPNNHQSRKQPATARRSIVRACLRLKRQPYEQATNSRVTIVNLQNNREPQDAIYVVLAWDKKHQPTHNTHQPIETLIMSHQR